MKFRGFLLLAIAVLALVAMTAAAKSFTGTILAANLFTQAVPTDERNADNSGCTLSNVAGTYGYVGSGTVRPGNPIGLPAGTYTSVGTLNFDDRGNVVITDTARVDDFFLPPNQIYAATYTVDRQCMATMTITAWAQMGLPGPHFKGVFVDERHGFRGMTTGPGASIHYDNTTRIEKKD